MDTKEIMDIIEGRKEFKGEISEETKQYVDEIWDKAFKSK